MVNTLEEWFQEMPVVTRAYLSLAVLTTLAATLDFVSAFDLYFNWNLITNKLELWRLVTNFLYFGRFDIDFFFHMFFLVRYCRLLEEGSFRGHTADFIWMILLGAGVMTAVAPFISIHFLGSSLTFMMVYVWGRRNEHVRMSFLGLFSFNAPYLPWVWLGFSMLLGNSPVVDLLGMAAGHIYYFFEDIYPISQGKRPLRTPMFLKRLFGDVDVEQPPPVYEHADQGHGAAENPPEGEGDNRNYRWGEHWNEGEDRQ
eukprot:Rmarinus@m.1150